MAAKGQRPVMANPLAARAAFEHDLAVVLGGRQVAEAGWTRPDDLALLVPVTGYMQNQPQNPPFTLKLEFRHYPEWPPSAQFVNPATKLFNRQTDLYWLPRIESDEIRTHSDYGDQHIQLICCSVTLEFYDVLHEVDDRFVWKHPRQTFAATLNQIVWGLGHHYNGRFAPNP